MKIIIDDLIRSGSVSYNIGDEVIVYRRKANGYPKFLKDDVVYNIVDILTDGHVYLKESGKNSSLKVHKKYVINKSVLRDIKINQILNT
jgi:hypothetical protein